MSSKRNLIGRANRVALCAMLVLAWSVPMPRCARADAGTTATATVSIDRMFSAIKNVASDLPRDSFDPQAAIDQAGREPQKLFDWVRKNTSWAPYDGELRGASGVLMDRVGNSLDRALLLSDLLNRCGYKTRLAHVRLPATQANELLKAAHDSWRQPTPIAASKLDIAKLAERTGLPAAVLERTWRSKNTAANEAQEDALQRVSEQTPVLSALLTDAGKTALATQTADELRAITEHYWVQYESAAKWIDLDLAAADGKAIAKAADTLAPEKMPAANRHTLRIHVVIEQWAGGRLTEHELLANDLNPATISGQRVALLHSPLKFPTDTDVSAGDDPLAAVRAAMLAQKDWVPVLQVGSSTLIGKSFNDAGDVSDKATGNPAANLGAGGVDAFGGFGGALGGGGEGAEKHLTAEWIEYVLHVPGHGDSTIRREIFDLVGPAVRASGKIAEPSLDETKRLTIAGALLGGTEIRAFASQPSEAFVADVMARSTLARQPLMARLAAGENVDLNEAAKDPPPSGQLYGLALARQGWARHADTFLDRINIVTVHTGLRPGADGLLMCEGFDIVENGVGVRPGADPLAARIEQGVLDTNAEAILTESCGKVRNTGELMMATPAEGWTLIRSANDPAWKAAHVDEDVRARVNQDLSRGMVVALAPQADESRPACWWRIDPKTGQTLGIGNRGWGQSTSELAAYNLRLLLNWFDVFYCTWSSMHSHVSNNIKTLFLAACLVKTSLKGANLLIKGPQAIGFTVVFDVLGDMAGGLAINAVKLAN